MATDDPLRKVPPNDPGAEAAVLGACLIDPGVFTQVAALIGSDDFYQSRHEQIFAAMQRLHGEGAPVDDVVVVVDALRSAGYLDEIGGPSYLAELADIEHTPTPTHAVQYAKIVRRTACARALALHLTGAANEALDGADIADIIGRTTSVMRRLSARQLSDDQSFAQVLSEVFDNLGTNTGNYVSTRYPTVDSNLGGGLRRGDLVTLAAATTAGKTTLAVNLGVLVAVNKGKVLMLSAEMTAPQIAKRVLFASGRVEIWRERGLDQFQRARIKASRDTVGASHFELKHRPRLTPLMTRAEAEQQKLRWDGLDLVIVDYLNLMMPDSRQERREREVAVVTRELKVLAGELDCPVLLVAQLNRRGSDRGDEAPTLSDLRDSGAIEQDSDVVMFLHHPSYDPANREPHSAALTIRKQRDGLRDIEIALNHYPSMTLFEEVK